jgi:hypothetical protein
MLLTHHLGRLILPLCESTFEGVLCGILELGVFVLINARRANISPLEGIHDSLVNETFQIDQTHYHGRISRCVCHDCNYGLLQNKGEFMEQGKWCRARTRTYDLNASRRPERDWTRLYKRYILDKEGISFPFMNFAMAR